MFSYRERFYGFQKGGNNYAPLTLGSPEYVNEIDYSTFRKSKQEKIELAAIKAQHKLELRRVYGPGNKKLNVSAADIP